jgi:hypothetical protein
MIYLPRYPLSYEGFPVNAGENRRVHAFDHRT